MKKVRLYDGNSILLVDPSNIESIGQAYPSNRVLQGSSDSQYSEEWLEDGLLPDGRECTLVYLFDDDDIDGLDPEDYPWDDGLNRIRVND